MDELALLAGLVLLFVIIAPILGVIGFFQHRNSVEKIDRLDKELAEAKRKLTELEARFSNGSRLGKPPAETGGIAEPAQPPDTATEDIEAPSTPDDQDRAAREQPEDQDAHSFTDAELDLYDGEHLAVLDTILKPATDTDPSDRRQRDMREIAEKIRAKIGLGDAVPDARLQAFLTTFADALRSRLQDRMAPDRPDAAAPAIPAQARGLEETLASQWMVWLGAAAVGLSAVFLVSYAAEQGWLGPEARAVMGVLLGLALIMGGEWLHRRPDNALNRAVSPDYVPPALTASGLFSLFVSVFAAHGLFGLIPAAVAFAALGVVAFAGLVLALRQGWFVGLLGLIGGYLVPALLESDAPNALPVFLFLFVLTAGCLALMVYRTWWWLSFATIVGALGWFLLWLADPWTLADQGILATYAVGVAALFALFSVNLPVKLPDQPAYAWLAAMLADTSGLGFTLCGVLLVVLAVVCDFNEAAFLFLGIYAGLAILFGVRRAAFESLAVAAALVVMAAVSLWPVPSEILVQEELIELARARGVTAFGPYLMPTEFQTFARALLGFAVLFGIAGLAASRRAASPAVWSALSAGVPLYLLVLGYWRIAGFEIDLEWSALAAVLCVFNLAAATLSLRWISQIRTGLPVAFHAAACTAALALAFTCVLREAWLTVALATEVAALAWIWLRLRVAEMRLIALVVVAALVVRLVLNYQIVEYEGSVAGVFSWVTYGYGLPALCLFLAAHLFRTGKDATMTQVCQAVGAGFAFLMVALQLRTWTAGSIDDPGYDLFDQSIQSLWWLITASALLRRELAGRADWAFVGGLILLGVTIMQIVLGHAFLNNPVLSAEPVGTLPVLNLLFLAYGLPAIVLWAVASGSGFLLPDRVRDLMRVLASALVFLDLTLEVRRTVWGTQIMLDGQSPVGGEIYAYSAAWTVYALALLTLGIFQRASFWRYVSLAVLIVTVLKVFLYDMSDLTGLYRVASFLGLGLSLIGIGQVYRRFVFRA